MFEFVEKHNVAIKVILSAVALTFVGFGVSSYSALEDPYIVKVGSARITRQSLENALERASRGRAPDASLRRDIFDSMVREELVLADAHDRGLAVGPELLRKTILAIPQFQKDGVFDQQQYLDALKAQNMSAATFESRLARDLQFQTMTMPFEVNGMSATVADRLAALLRESREVRTYVLTPQSFAAQVKTDDAALKAYYDANAARFRLPEAVRLSYVVLSQAALADGMTVPADEVAKYWEQHKADFGGEERRAAHILLAVPQGAKAADKARVRAEAEALLKQLRANPAKFAELAKARSQDPGSAAKGGDLGYFKQHVMTPKFDAAAFSLKPGQISDLVETEFGFHIIRVDDVKQPDLSAMKAEVESRLKKQKAATAFRTAADKLSEIAYQQGDSLKAVEDQLKLKAQSSDWLTRGAPAGKDLLNNARVIEAAFSDDVLNKKHNSEVLDVGNNTLVVVRVAEHRAARQQTLEEARDAIRAALVARDGAKLAETRGAALLADLKAGRNPELGWTEARALPRLAANQMDPDAARAIFSTSVKTLPAFAGQKRNGGEYVLYRIDKVIPAPALTPEERAQFMGQLGGQYGNDQAVAYLRSLSQRYPVKKGTESMTGQ